MHTKGPWHIKCNSRKGSPQRNGDIRAADNKWVCQVGYLDQIEGGENARLIAAVPDMVDQIDRMKVAMQVVIDLAYDDNTVMLYPAIDAMRDLV